MNGKRVTYIGDSSHHWEDTEGNHWIDYRSWDELRAADDREMMDAIRAAHNDPATEIVLSPGI